MCLLNEQLQEMVLTAEIFQQLCVVDRHRGPAGKRLHEFKICWRKLGGVQTVSRQAKGADKFITGNQGNNQGGSNTRRAQHGTISMLHNFLTGEYPPLALRANL